MIRKTLITGAALALGLAATPALAFHCPKDMKAIDARLAEGTAQLSEADMATVKQLRADGEAAHKAGKHQESVDALAKAMEMLGIK